MTSTWVPEEFLQRCPKTDLHVHLDGSLRLETLIELAQADGVELPSYTEAGLREKVFREHYADLPEYLQGFIYTVGVMQKAENIERIAYEFGEDNYNEGVRYFEVRFAPQLFANVETGPNRLSIRDTILAVNKGLSRAKDKFNQELKDNGDMDGEDSSVPPPYDYGIIVCAMRSFPPTPYYNAFLALHEGMDTQRCYGLASEVLASTAVQVRDEGVPVVAIDVAGEEKGFPNKAHRKAFDIAHENFLYKTVHAGEGFGPESIGQAINELHADRIGHGFHLFSANLIEGNQDERERAEYVRKLVKVVCDRRMAVEVCLTSNLGTGIVSRLEDHAMVKMLRHGVGVTINTDNRLVSDTKVSAELMKAVEAFHLSPKQLREIVINGFKRSFFSGPYSKKRKFIRAAMDYYDRLAREYNLDALYAQWCADNGVDQVPTSPSARARIDSVFSETDETFN